MPLDSADAKKLYIAGGVGVVLVLLVIIQLSRRQVLKYNAGHDLAVKTSQGLIKMNARMLADKLSKINADMQKFRGTDITRTYSPAVKKAIHGLEKFISDNPGVDLCKANVKANVIHQALSDAVTYDERQQAEAYGTIVEHDTQSYSDDRTQFEFFLTRLDILINLLHNEVCVDGLLDLDMLEKLLDFMEKDLQMNGHFEQSLGNEIGNRYDPYVAPRLPLFIREQGQLEGMDSRENHTKAPRKVAGNPMMVLHNKLQDRSEAFQTNNQTFGVNLVSDEDLLAGVQFTNYKGYLG
jgi:hypothetical protein